MDWTEYTIDNPELKSPELSNEQQIAQKCGYLYNIIKFTNMPDEVSRLWEDKTYES
jgi:hypothetical protein